MKVESPSEHHEILREIKLVSGERGSVLLTLVTPRTYGRGDDSEEEGHRNTSNSRILTLIWKITMYCSNYHLLEIF